MSLYGHINISQETYIQFVRVYLLPMIHSYICVIYILMSVNKIDPDQK